MFKLKVRPPASVMAVLTRLRTASLFCCVLSGAIAAASPAGAASVCYDLLNSLPPVGIKLPGGSLVEQLATRSGSTLDLHPDRPDGLELHSDFVGSAVCQRNIMTQTISGKEKIIDIGGFAGGEGALCAGDDVSLVTIDNRPALLEADGTELDKLDLRIVSPRGRDWSPACRIKIIFASEYGAQRSYCPGADCSALARASIREADMITRQLEAGLISGRPVTLTTAPDLDDLTLSQRASWDDMTRLFQQQHPQRGSKIPTFGQDDRFSGHIDGIVGWDTSVFPVRLDRRLMLGVIGTAGFGTKFGEDKGSAIYDLEGGDLKPVAGFHLNVVARIVHSVQVDDEKW